MLNNNIAMAVVVRNGKVLIQRRFRKTTGMIHEFPGGRIDQGESGKRAALRELFEETGMKSDIKIIGSDVLANEWGGEIHFVVMTVSPQKEPQAVEPGRQQTFHWLNIAEIPITDFCKADQQFIEQRLPQYISLSEYATYIDHETLRAMPCNVEKLIEQARRLAVEGKEATDNDSMILKLSTAALNFAIAGAEIEALELVGEVESVIQSAGLRAKTVAEIRTAQVLQFCNQLHKAKKELEELVSTCRHNDKLSDLLDFSLQHLGKVYFDLNQILKAQSCFNEAMQIRQTKNDEALICSTQIAIDACTKRSMASKCEPCQ